MKQYRTTALRVALSACFIGSALAQTLLIDTGQPTGGIPGGILCAKTCGGGATFQNLAGQFTLTSSNSISSVQLWVQSSSPGGQLAVVIRTDSAGLPGSSIYSQTYTVPNQSTTGWVTFTFSSQPILSANTPYWVSFEPVVGSNISYNTPGGAPNPLTFYALFNSLNSGPFTEALNFGVRVSGTPEAAPTLLIDTGQGTNPNFSLFSNSANYEYGAGQFTLSQAATLTSFNAYMLVTNPGTLNVKVYAGDAPFYNNIVPSTNSIYSQAYPLTVSTPGGDTGWFTFPLSPPYLTLAAGTYWVSFEPAQGTFQATLYGSAPNPLPNYAYLVNGNVTWVNYSSLGSSIQVMGNNLPPASFGTAARTIMTGSAFGIPDTPQDAIAGGSGIVSTPFWNFITPSGWSYGGGTVTQNGLSAGAYSSTSGPCGSGTCGVGAGRGVAYRTWNNTTNQPLTFQINAQLEGEFQLGGGLVSAGVYVFDSTGFANTITASGLPTEQFLLNPSSLTALSSGGLSLAGLFPQSAVLLSNFQTVTGPLSQQLTIPITTDFVTVNPQSSLTVMFDVLAWAPPASDVNFSNTLRPSATLPLFTDANGAPVTGLVAVGPSVPPTVTPTSLTLTPPTSSNPVGTNASVTATVTDSTGKPVPNALVFFSFNSGPNTGPSGPISTDSNGQSVFTYTGNGGAGTDVIQATLGSLSAGPVSVTWTVPGPLDHITISPATTTIASGGSQAYSASGFDRFNNAIGDVTAQTTFTIAPDGTCSTNTCTATASGSHNVTANDNGKTAQAVLTVSSLQTPQITWQTPVAITYGTALSAIQLNATANVPGTFAYTPAAGQVLGVGIQTLSVLFTPTNTAAYSTVTATVNLQVNKATPQISWATPAPVTSGTALGAAQLNATANVAGTFVYTPPAGTVLNAGSQTLSVTFTPTDGVDYTTASAQVTLVVTAGKQTPVIIWATPAAITYLTPLSRIQLNATANVAGKFVYWPPVGAILTAGSHALSVTLTPTNTNIYSPATATVTLVVNKATPQFLWLPVPISYGTPLGPLQLDALTLIPGKFSYTPGAGTILPAGLQKLSAVFTPNDTTDFTTASLQTTLLVVKAYPVISWPTPAPITANTPLGPAQLNATANVPGTFVYSPAAGTKLSAGSKVLTVVFTPTDTADYESQKASVTITVKPH